MNGVIAPDNLRFCTIDPVEYANEYAIGHAVACPGYGDAEANVATQVFDAAGDVTSSTTPDGGTTLYFDDSTDNPGLPTQTTDPDGKITTDTYDARGDVLTETVSDTSGSYSSTTESAYDAAGRKWCEVSAYDFGNGSTCPGTEPSTLPTGETGYTYTKYDDLGRVIATVSPTGGTTAYAYDGGGQPVLHDRAIELRLAGKTCPAPGFTTPTTGNDPYPGVTLDQFDSDNRLVQETGPLGGITLTSYNPAGQVLQTEVESNNATSDPPVITSYTYDANGRVLTTSVGPTGSSHTSSKEYDPDGNVYCSMSANAAAGQPTAGQCAPWQPGWIATPPTPASVYSATPSPQQFDDVTTTFYNADGTQVQTTDPDVQTTVTAVDADQRAYCTVDPTNVAKGVLCPALGAAHVTGTSTTAFSGGGETLSTTDADGGTTTYDYDPAGNKVDTINPDGVATFYCYYGSGCAPSAPPNGGSNDDLYSEQDPSLTDFAGQNVTTYTYYPGDLVDTKTTPAGTATDVYDASSNLTSTSYSNTAPGYTTPATTTYTYDAGNSVLTMTDGTGTTTYVRDAVGDETQQQFVAAPGSGLTSNTTSYGYFSTGVRSSVSYPAYGSQSSPTANYAYDAYGNMTSVSDWLGASVGFSYDADGNQTGQTNGETGSTPSGTSSTQFAYDAANENSSATSTIAQSCSSTPETLAQSFSGTGGSRNPDGQLTADSQSYTGSCSSVPSYQRDYSYDAAGRLVYEGTTPQVTGQTTLPDNYAYDPAGDLTQISNSDTSGGFDTYTNSLDQNGMLLGQTPTTGSGNAVNYSFDSLGDRTSTTTPAGVPVSTSTYNQIGEMTSSSSTGQGYRYSGDGLVSGKGKPTWSGSVAVDKAKAINHVSCASASVCVAVDHAGKFMIYNGTSWSAPAYIQPKARLVMQGISCPSSTFCMAVGNVGDAYVFNGTSWSGDVGIPKGHTLESVSCLSSTFCVAVGADGQAYSYSGSSLSLMGDPDGKAKIVSVSCPSMTFCVAVGAQGGVLTYSLGSGWSAPVRVDSTHTLNSVSCSSPSFCVAVDANGNGVVYSHAGPYTASQWHVSNVDGARALESVTCIDPSFCKAVDADGSVLSLTFGSWSAATDIDGAHALESISCPSESRCAAVDNNGGVLLDQVASQATDDTWDRTGSLPQLLSDGTDDYIYGPSGEPVEQINVTSTPPTSNPQYLTYTATDETWLITNAAGQQLSYYGFDAYGNLAFGVQGSPFGYAGQYEDGPTQSGGLYDMRARWYDSQTGNFTSWDPAFSQTHQAYSYADGDPMNGNDPSGMATLGICAGFNVAPLVFSTGAGDCLVRTIQLWRG